jgi:renalase
MNSVDSPPIPAAPHCAVVGAGIAGLACASVLRQAGCTVSVFEKSRGPGGRMSTRRGWAVDGSPIWQCDHGAQYFTARDPVFRAEVLRWQQAGVAALWQPRLKVFDAAATRASDAPLERWVGTPGMNAPARWLGETLNVHTGSTVQALHYEAAHWSVSTAEQGRLPARFDALVLALPAPQAAPLLRGAIAATAATPEAPAAPAALAALGTLGTLADSAIMRACWAVMLRFAVPPALPFEAAFVNHGPLRWIACDSAKPGRGITAPTWLLHASAAWSEAHLEDDAEHVAAALLAAFRELGGAAPQHWSTHRWRYADTETPLQLGCAWQARPRVGLCGDWLNGGKVEGAWLSGQRLAQQMLQSWAGAS